MGNAAAATDLDGQKCSAKLLASGIPQELDWRELILQVFQPEHQAILVLTPKAEEADVAGKTCKVIKSVQGSRNGPVVAEFKPELLGNKVAMVSQQGRKSKPQPNQDAAFYLSFVDGDGAPFWMACVMDGHGPLGHDMSRLLMQWLPLMVLRDPIMAREPGHLVPFDPQTVFDGISSAFAKLGPLMARASAGTTARLISGTTCVFAICGRGLLHTANVGDSRAVLTTRPVNHENGEESRSALDLKLDVRTLTRDHKPDDPEEKPRIEACGGIVRDNRVWLQKPPYTGLNMARSFGDNLSHEVGVSFEADVAVTFVQEGEPGQFLILASDGIWELISSEMAAESVASSLAFSSVPSSATRLVSWSTDLWQSSFGKERDDITVILICF